MVELLDKILMSNNVVKNFKIVYQDLEFKNWLTNILPEVEDCNNLNQDNPWHIYNCLDHILHSVEEMNRQTLGLNNNLRRMLAYTMFLHDIGKPQTKIRRYSKVYKREVDSFFDHNLASEKIANRVLNKFNFSKLESKIIQTLVKQHDIFMFITLKEDGNKHHNVLTKDYFASLINELNQTYNGEKLMEYLIMVGRADNKAQNPLVIQNSLKLLGKMQDFLLEYKSNQNNPIK